MRCVRRVWIGEAAALIASLPVVMVLAAAVIAVMLPGGEPSAAASEVNRGVRPAAVAGSWYPDRHSLIAAEVDRLVRATAAAPAPGRKPVAIVVPHAGWRYSAFAAATAFRLLGPGDFDRVVVIGPSHRAAFDGFAVPDFSAFRTPAGDVPICQDAVKKISDGALVRPVAGAHEPEHSIEIEVPFLQERLVNFCLVPILAGRTDPAGQAELATRLARLDDGRTLFVFSSDFTHYGPRYDFSPFGPHAAEARAKIRDLDDRAVALLTAKDAAGFRRFLDQTSDTICGREGLKVMLELLPRIAPKARALLLADYASIDIPGIADDNSVTYVAMAFAEGAATTAAGAPPLGAPVSPAAAPPDAAALPPEVGARLLKVARATLRTELLGGDDVSQALKDLPSAADVDLARLQATFVTLRRKEPASGSPSARLRGCIGQVAPAYTLAEAVVMSASGAALQDPRFPPVTASELAGLEVELTVLSTPRPIASWDQIELGRHGILMTKGNRRAVFLPEVPVQEGWTLEETLDHLARKAGMSEDAWREGATFQVFEGQVFNEPR